MSCCTKTYDLGCYNSCSLLSFGNSAINGIITGVFTFQPTSAGVTQDVTAVVGLPFVFDLSLVNESADYMLQMYNSDGEKISVEIDGQIYDCFKFRTVLYGGVNIQGEVLPENPNIPITITGDGTDTYVIPELISRTIRFVFTENVVRLRSEWTFDNVTGTLVFVDGPRDTGENIQIDWI